MWKRSKSQSLFHSYHKGIVQSPQNLYMYFFCRTPKVYFERCLRFGVHTVEVNVLCCLVSCVLRNISFALCRIKVWNDVKVNKYNKNSFLGELSLNSCLSSFKFSSFLFLNPELIISVHIKVCKSKIIF